MREERRLRVFEIRVLRRIFGPKSEELTGEWRKLHKDEISDLYSSSDIVPVIIWRRMRWAEYVERMGEREEAYKGFWRKPEGRDRLEDRRK